MNRALRCAIFYCDHMRINICCSACGYNGKCKNRCLNDPDKCECTVTKMHMHRVEHQPRCVAI